jgi:hypothetical protein
MFFVNKTNGIEGTPGAPPALILGADTDFQQRRENTHGKQPQNPA